jgi:hypothetical protein
MVGGTARRDTPSGATPISVARQDFLLGPPVVGGLAELVGLREPLVVIALAGLAVFTFSLFLQEPAQGECGRKPAVRTRISAVANRT